MSPQPPGPPPGKGCGSRGAGPRAPSCRVGAGGGAAPLCSSDPGSRLPYPSRLPDRVPRPLWVAGRLLNIQLLGSEPSWAGPAASTAIGSCTSLSVSAEDGSNPKLVGRFSTWVADLRVLSAATMWLEERTGKGGDPLGFFRYSNLSKM